MQPDWLKRLGGRGSRHDDSGKDTNRWMDGVSIKRLTCPGKTDNDG
jgi:hypothetical protein